MREGLFSRPALQPLAIALLMAVNASAKSDNSLSNLFNLGNLNWMMLEQQQGTPDNQNVSDNLTQDLKKEMVLAQSIGFEKEPAQNSIDENKISFTQHTFNQISSSSSSDSSEDSSDDDFSLGVPIFPEMANPNNPHYNAYMKYQEY